MAKVRIITDITASLDPDLVEQYQITVLPVEIRFGDETFHIQPGDGTRRLFERMAEGPAQPTEATIPASEFHEAFSRLCREGSDILVLLGSSKLNNAYEQARSASRPFLGRCHITILDSMSASWGLGLMVEASARAAEKGWTLDQIVRLVRGILPHVYLVFFVERLDYLEYGGRIDPAQALLGTMLQIKPLLFIEDGDIVPMEKVRTQSMAIEKLADFVTEFASIQRIIILTSPLKGSSNEMIKQLREHLSLALPGMELPVIEYDPVLACHLGPEALGVIVYEGD
jgi:DegV family protein with EDD domain